jgi:S-adenosylmethionine:tRNA ribosyltransferase-isomerase
MTRPRRAAPRDGVRMLVSRRTAGAISHHRFPDLAGLLRPGDLIVVNTSGTLPAQIRAGDGLAVHFSTPVPDGGWLVELRTVAGPSTAGTCGTSSATCICCSRSRAGRVALLAR